MVCVTEAGLYTLILRCRTAMKPGTPAFTFRRWVTGEVLPQIRKSGKYEAKPPSRLELAEMVIELEREKARLEQTTERLLPAAKFGQELMDTDGLFTINQVAKALGTTAIQLNRFLHDQRVVYRQNDEWLPYAKYDNRGLFKIVAYTIDIGPSDGGNTRVKHSLKVTAQGRAFIHGLWRGEHRFATA
jgi:phage antirepressor YoqD-like protein